MNKKDLLLKLQIHFNNTSHLKWKVYEYWINNGNWGDIPDDIKLKTDFENNESLDILKRELKEYGISYITILDNEYPSSLKNNEYPPLVLFYKGDIRLLNNSKKISIVGSRKTNYDLKKLTKEWAKYLAMNGVTVVSGFAVGVDISAHIGALESFGDTIAVLGCGLNVNYPVTNEKWRSIIEEKGLIISEYLPDTKPIGYLFPFRNRIIAALGDALLVISGTKKSGTMSTVGWALDMGKIVMAVPGFVYYPYSEGPNFLIRNGAIPVVSYRDVIEEMGWETMDSNSYNLNDIEMTEREKIVYDLIASGYDTIDEIAYKAGYDRGDLFILLMNMEIKGIIERKGNTVCLKYH